MYEYLWCTVNQDPIAGCFISSVFVDFCEFLHLFRLADPINAVIDHCKSTFLEKCH